MIPVKHLMLALLSVIWIGLLAAAGQATEGITKASPESSSEKIQITADQLVTDNQNQYAEFSGDVVAQQGNFEIKADRLRIYYAADLRVGQKATDRQDAISKIIAEGNVRIKAEDNFAQTEKAEYSVPEMQIVLIGEESKVIRGKNSITGARIVYNRKEGWIRVEKGQKKRVRAVFYPDEKTMPGGDPLKKEP